MVILVCFEQRYYTPRHDVGNGIRYRFGVQYLSVCLHILNSFNISGMDEAIHSLNLASGSTTASPTPRVKNFPRKGRGLGHVIVFVMKPRCLNFANALTVASATPGVKDPPETGVVSVT